PRCPSARSGLAAVGAEAVRAEPGEQAGTEGDPLRSPDKRRAPAQRRRQGKRRSLSDAEHAVADALHAAEPAVLEVAETEAERVAAAILTANEPRLRHALGRDRLVYARLRCPDDPGALYVDAHEEIRVLAAEQAEALAERSVGRLEHASPDERVAGIRVPERLVGPVLVRLQEAALREPARRRGREIGQDGPDDDVGVRAQLGPEELREPGRLDPLVVVDERDELHLADPPHRRIARGRDAAVRLDRVLDRPG